MSQQQKQLADFRLERQAAADMPARTYEFLTTFIGGPIDVADWTVNCIARSDDHRLLLTYAVSITKLTLLVVKAELEDEQKPGDRFTEMRLYEMLVDSWMFAGGQPDALRYLGIWMVQNPAAETQMCREFSRQETTAKTEGRPAPGGRLALRLQDREGTSFQDNAFLRCGLSLARDLSRVSAQVIELKKADFTRTGADGDDWLYYICMQFGPEDAEEVADAIPAVHMTGEMSESDGGEDEVVFGGRGSNRGL